MLGFNDTSILVGYSVAFPREIEEIVEMKQRDREKRRTGMKVKKEVKKIPPLSLPTTRIAGLAQLQASISWTPRWRKIHDTFATLDPTQELTAYVFIEKWEKKISARGIVKEEYLVIILG